MGLPEGSGMFFSGYEATMLALEANSVIGLRLIKIAHGGVDAVQEVNLMVREKVDAGARAGCFWLESRRGFPNQLRSDSTCWLGGGSRDAEGLFARLA